MSPVHPTCSGFRSATGWPRPTRICIDLAALAHNIQRLRAIAGVDLMAVVKANAYGHGDLAVARTALAHGASALAVATLGEALALREAGIDAPILLFGYVPAWQAIDTVGARLITTVYDQASAQALSAAAQEIGRRALVHVKVDTGMGRLGVAPADTSAFLDYLAQLPGLQIDGLYTHFATADSADETFAQQQLSRFEAILGSLGTRRPPVIHAANSAALLRFPAARYDMVRPGIACYGLNPSDETPLPADMQPVLTFASEVAQVKAVSAGVPLSYGGIFVTTRPSRIATIPVGYADGVRRSPPWREVLVGGQRAPIVGRVCMDYVLIDVTDIANVQRGDPVVLIGQQGDSRLTADDVARWFGTINYEVVSALLARVPRSYQ